MTRAEASRKVRDAIVAATVGIVGREGVAAVTHRRVAAEAGVSLSSTTWHFAAKADILESALRWTADQEVARIGAIAERLGDDPADWAEELAGWLIGQVTEERETAVALYRLQIELVDSPAARAVHRDWGRALRALGERVAPDLDARLAIAALDGLRLGTILSGAPDAEWLRAAVRRQVRALLG